MRNQRSKVYAVTDGRMRGEASGSPGIFRKENLRSTAGMLVLANLVFFLLYARFFISNRTYIYIDDIGADSFSASVPIIAMLGRLARAGVSGGFTLAAGLGFDVTALMTKYVNPLKAPLLLFGRSKLWAGILLELFLQTNVIALASWSFFRRLLRQERAAACAVLAWSFSGYITLWSQNLTAGSCMAMFSVLMAAVLLMCERPTVLRWLGLALAAGLFLVTNYYYCYMSAYFCLIFYVFYAVRRRLGVRTFLARGLLILGAVIFAGGLALFALVPNLADFTGSVRTGWLGHASSGLRLLNTREILTALGRLLSVNTFGVGDSYSGMSNYYEEAALSTTLLVFPALVYLLRKRSTRLMTALAALLCVVSLYVKNTGALLQFNANAQRYSYMIAYVSALALGVFVRDIITAGDSRALRLSALIGGALETALVVLLFFRAREPGCYASQRTLVVVLFFVFIETAALVLCSLWKMQPQSAGSQALSEAVCKTPASKNRGQLRAVRMGLVPSVLLTVLLAAELLVMNYATLYHRIYVQKTDYAEALDDYGIGTAAGEILDADEDLYRISAADSSDFDHVLFNNAGMLAGFAGTSVYSSTNPASLSTLTRTLGSSELTQNHFTADGTEMGLFQLLAGRYLIRDNTEHAANTLPEAFYERIGEGAGGSKAVYKTKAALPFGYLYTEEADTEEALALTLPERMELLGRAWFETPTEEELAQAVRDKNSGTGDYETMIAGAGSAAQSEAAAEAEAETGSGGTAGSALLRSATDLLGSGFRANDLEEAEKEGYTSFKPTGGDPYQYYELGAQKRGTWRALYLRQAKSNPYPNDVRQLQLFYLSAEDEEPDPADCLFFTIQPDCPETLIVLPDDVTGFRLDFPQDGSRTDLQVLSVLEFDAGISPYAALSETEVSGISMEGGSYHAELVAEEDGVFCVPLLYSANWVARVNGAETEVQNINGGFVGIPVEAGRSGIELNYETPSYTRAAWISAAFAVLWVLLLAAALRKH